MNTELQIALLQKQNAELKDTNRKLREQIMKATKQINELAELLEELKFQRDCAQAINILNNRRELANEV